MKKVFAIVAMATLAACGSGASTEVATDSTAVTTDSTTVSADTTAAPVADTTATK